MKNVIVTQTKDQSTRLLPWFLNHYEQGFDAFIFFDDYSEDDTINIINYIKNEYKIKIIYCQTDGIGSIRTTEETKNSDVYNGDTSLHYRLCRSYNTGLQMVKQINSEAFIAFLDVDEFLVTNQNKKIVDIINELYQENNFGHLHIQSLDIDDTFELDGFYTVSEKSKYRWNYEVRQNTMWAHRGKSIVRADYIDKINQYPNVVHTLFDNGRDCGVFTKPYIIPNIDDLKIHHFRKPSNDPNMKLEYDDTLYNFSVKIKDKYNIQ
jgi:hypothetical protein